MSRSKTTPTIIPPIFTKTNPPESFSSPEYGSVTWHTLISSPQTDTTDLSAGIAVCPPKSGNLCAHRHSQAEIYHILEGEGEVTIDGVVRRVSAGSTVFIPSNAEHGTVNTGEKELRVFYVFPTTSFGDIIYRFSKDEGMHGDGGVKAKL